MQDQDRKSRSGAAGLAKETPREGDSTVDLLSPSPAPFPATTVAPLQPASATPAAPAFPEFNDYEILDEISRGGMGVVYRARQISLNRIVALKLIRTERYSGRDISRRFQREAKAAAGLKHPHIVSIFESGEEQGLCFYSMEYIEGKNLADLLLDGPLPVADSARYLEEIAGAVDYAHRQKVLHRDLKPANVLLDKQQSLHVTDFGIAKQIELDSDLTATGDILGTPAYMSPEQSLGKPVGPPSDIYSLGAMLYSLLTSRPPFCGATSVDTLVQVRTVEPASPRLVNADVPLDLETICLKCLEKKPERRYQSAAELVEDLRLFRERKPVTARPVGRPEKLRRWCTRNPTVAMLIALVVVLLLGGTGVSSMMYVAEAAALGTTREVVSRLYVREANLLEPGRLMYTLPWLAKALEADEGNPVRETVSRRRLGTALRACPQLEQMWLQDAPAGHATFSPDGRYVLMVGNDGYAQVCEAATGTPVTKPLIHEGHVNHGTFSDDGQYVATGCSNGEAHVWDVSTGELVSTVVHDPRADLPELPGLVSRVCFGPSSAEHPDQLMLATVSRDRTGRVWDAKTGEELTRLQHQESLRDIQFDPQGRFVVTASGDGTARIRALSAIAAADPEEDLVLTHQYSPGPLEPKQVDQVTALAITPDGRYVITGTIRGKVWFWNAETGEREVEEPLQQTPGVTGLACSRDGMYLATASRDGEVRLWGLPLGNEIQHGPMKHHSPVGYLAFSEDSAHLVSGSMDGIVRVWQTESGDPVTPWIPHNRSIRSVELCRGQDDELRLLTAADKLVRLWTLPGQGARLTLPHQQGVFTILQSAAAQRFVIGQREPGIGLTVCDVAEDGTLSVRAVTADEQEPVHETGVRCAAISADGQLVATGAYDHKVIIRDVETGAAVAPPLDLEYREAAGIQFSSDGKFLLTLDRKSGGWTNVCCWEIAAPTSPLWQASGQMAHGCFNPSATTVAIAVDAAVQLRDVRTGEVDPTEFQHEKYIYQCHFSPDGTLLATSSTDGMARLWSLEKGELLHPPLHHSNSVHTVKFDPTGRRLVTTSVLDKARVWDVATGSPLTRRLPHRSREFPPVFDPTGRFLLTVTEDPATEYIWDVETSELTSLTSLDNRHTQAARFTGLDRQILVLQKQNPRIHPINYTLQLYQVASDDRSVSALQNQTELLSGQYIDRLADSLPLTSEALHQRWREVSKKRKTR